MSFFEPEELTIDHLAGTLGIHVADDHPEEDLDEYAVVTRAGGPALSRRTDAPLIIADFYARRPKRAAELAGLGRDAIADMPRIFKAQPRVTMATEAGGPTRLRDSDRPNHTRYTMTAEIRIQSRRTP